jgi:hypothetical protein
MGLPGVVDAAYRDPPSDQKLRLRSNCPLVEASNSIWNFQENEWRLTFGI